MTCHNRCRRMVEGRCAPACDDADPKMQQRPCHNFGICMAFDLNAHVDARLDQLAVEISWYTCHKGRA